MAGQQFNGSTIAFASAIAPLRSIGFDNPANEIDVTGSTDTQHSYRAGLINTTVTCQIVGNTTLLKGATGTLTVFWADSTGTTTDGIGTLSEAVLVGKSIAGSLGGEILTELTFRPLGSS